MNTKNDQKVNEQAEAVFVEQNTQHAATETLNQPLEQDDINTMQVLQELESKLLCELFQENGLIGLKKRSGKILLPALFEEVFTPSYATEGDLVPAMQQGLWGIVRADGQGTWVVQPEFDYVGYVDKLAPVRKNGMWGVLNVETMSYLIPLECDIIYVPWGHMFNNNAAVYSKDGKLGVIRPDGRFTPPIFEDVEAEYQDMLRVRFEGVWGFLDENSQFTTNEKDAFWGCFETE